ncbi:MAG: hypothetical protein ACE5IP_03595 [Terriglobia bacterium]
MRRSVLLATVLLLVLANSVRAEEETQAKPASPRYLVICLDGVGYDLVEEMYRRGELRHFLPPVPVITAFPSLTNVSLVEILGPLGAPPARGYEDYYFDPARNRMRGGIFQRLSRKHFVAETYRGLFHYHPNQVRMTLEYALPVLGPWLNGAVTWGRIKARFRKSKERMFLAYFDSSDLATHVNGKWLVRRQLRALDRLAGELRSNPDTPVEVIAFSDHGNGLRRMRKAKLKKALKRAGFHLARKLKDARSVILPQFGLVSAAVLYVQSGREAALAEALRETKGVNLSVYRRDGSLYVVGRGGRAQIQRREAGGKVWFRYRTEEGDPLRLDSIAARLADTRQADAEGFLAEESWLRATAGHIYPDPLRRLWSAFDGLVEQPASVLVSLDDDYYTGSVWLDIFAWLRATHGNLRRAQSRGVILSTDPALFLPDRGPFTGRNLFLRLAATWEHVVPSLTWLREQGAARSQGRRSQTSPRMVGPARRTPLAPSPCGR